MLCVRCQTPNPDTSRFCSHCGESFGTGVHTHGSLTSLGTTPGDSPVAAGYSAGDSMALTSGGHAATPGRNLAVLPPGFILGNRYEVHEPLGMGGMGMVYRATDRHLDVPVALKLIRAEYADIAPVLERFKKEITIARRVTHRNVARIYDMGEAEGLRYISMEYIEGQDLSQVVEKNGPMPIERALSVMRQVCSALEEAHAAGVVHRDLKPHNVMLDASGRARVMDFGIAMSVDIRGMTRTGALIGTPEYMSPEQAQGRKVDHRTDIYSFGAMMYELVAGTAPFKGTTAWEVIQKQVGERATSLRKARPEIPEWLDTLILKCLEKDPALRYQSVAEILRDIEKQQAHLSVRRYIPSRQAIWAATGMVILVAAAVGVTLMLRPKVPVAGTGERRSVAILPFENQTGREQLDWLRTGLADNLTTDLAESKYFRLLSRERLSQILRELKLEDASDLDADALKKIAEFGGVETILTGSFLSTGDRIRVNLRLVDPLTGEILRTKSLSQKESQVLGMMDDLTVETKKMFELAPERIAGDTDLKIAQAHTASVESASLFQKGVDLLYAGKNLEAIAPLAAAVAADPQFAMAHARLAEAHMRTGHDREAVDASRAAMDRMVAQAEKIPQQNRTFIRALSGIINNQPEESILAYEEMMKADPDNPFVAFSLGEALERMGEFGKAMTRYREAARKDPKDPALRLALGRVAIKSGDSRSAIPDLEKALSLYTEMGSDEGKGNTLNAIGRANDLLGRFPEALDYYGRSEKVKRHIGDKRGLAVTLDNKAGLLQLQGRLPEATEITEEALSLIREIGDKEGTARTLTNLGSLREEAGDPEGMIRYYSEALALRRGTKDRLEQVICLNSLGRAETALGRMSQARAYLLEADRIARETGDTSGAAQALSDQAEIDYLHGELRVALKKQSEAVKHWGQVKREDGIAEAQSRLGKIQAGLGQAAAARASLESSLTTYAALEDRHNEARVTLALAGLDLTSGEAEKALSLLQGASSSLDSMGNPVLLAEKGLLMTKALSERADSPGARTAAEQACLSSSLTRAVVPAIQCELARSIASEPDEAIAAGLIASTRAADSGIQLYQAEADLALAMAYHRAGKTQQASARARQALELARKMGLADIVARAERVARESRR